MDVGPAAHGSWRVFSARRQRTREVAQEQRLIGDVGEDREHCLNLTAGAAQGARQERQRPDRQLALQRSPDDVRVGSVETRQSDQRKHGAETQPLTLQRSIIVIRVWLARAKRSQRCWPSANSWVSFALSLLVPSVRM